MNDLGADRIPGLKRLFAGFVHQVRGWHTPLPQDGAPPYGPRLTHKVADKVN
jgi:hypothetical protein